MPQIRLLSCIHMRAAAFSIRASSTLCLGGPEVDVSSRRSRDRSPMECRFGSGRSELAWPPSALLRTGRYQLENQSANYLRLVFSARSGQRIGPFKAARSLHAHLPILARTRSGDRYSPVGSSVGKCVFDARSNVSAQLSIAEILQFDGHSHSTVFYRPEYCPSMVQSGERHARQAHAAIVNILTHHTC
jgi:hypothetical protein